MRKKGDRLPPVSEARPCFTGGERGDKTAFPKGLPSREEARFIRLGEKKKSSGRNKYSRGTKGTWALYEKKANPPCRENRGKKTNLSWKKDNRSRGQEKGILGKEWGVSRGPGARRKKKKKSGESLKKTRAAFVKERRGSRK